MKKIQSVLGDHQDTVVARAGDPGPGRARSPAGDEWFTFGLLYEREACDARSCSGRRDEPWERGLAASTGGGWPDVAGLIVWAELA